MRKELVTHLDPKSPVSETFRTLRTNIQFMNSNKELKTLFSFICIKLLISLMRRPLIPGII